MSIHENIREKRIALHYTQEQVATRLGVSTPAVNKWEKGISCPDIAILPALARLLETDINTLLSFEGTLSDQEVVLFLNTLADTFNKKSFEVGYKLAMDKHKEFPNCHLLSLHIGYHLESAIAKHKVVDKITYENIAINLYEHALLSTNLEVRTQAQSILIRKHMEHKEYEKADALLKEMPNKTSIDKKHIQAKVCAAKNDLENAMRLEEERLLYLIQDVQQSLLTIMEFALTDGRTDDAEEIAMIAKESVKLFNQFEYAAYVPACVLYTKQKKRMKCIQTYAKLLKALTKPWIINDSPLFRHIQISKSADGSISKEMRDALISSFKEDEETAFLKDDKEFQTMLQDSEKEY